MENIALGIIQPLQNLGPDLKDIKISIVLKLVLLKLLY